jgi:ABC-type bacteriocin/lantibiotic exporter with double-glycine peptidase domain
LSLANLPEKQLLIFDEADNALDTKNKRNFREKIKRLSESKIVIFISH